MDIIANETLNQIGVPQNPKGGIKLSDSLDYRCSSFDFSQSLSPVATLPYKISNPYYIFNPQLQEPFKDPYMKLLYLKHEYNRKIHDLRGRYRRAVRKKRNDIDNLEYYEKMQNIVEKDPDKYFNSNYNWYYSGGTLDAITIPSQTILIHGSQGSDLCFTGVSKVSKQWNINSQKVLQIPENIFEVKASANENHLIVGVRLKSKVNLHLIEDFDCDQFFYKDISPKTQNSVPLTSFALNSPDEYITLDVKQTITLWNTQRKRVKRTITVKESTTTCRDNWGQINYLNNNVILYINDNSYSQIDLRAHADLTTKSTEELQLSEEVFTNSCVKINENNFYLTTNKHVIEIDTRMNKIANKWSHLLKEPVFLSDTIENSTAKLICVASASPKERLILGHNEKGIEMPLVAPTLEQSLDECLSYKLSSHMIHAIRERNLATTTGLKFLNNDGPSILTSNYYGDIYVNELSDDSFDSSEILNRNMVEFEQLSDNLLTNIENSGPVHFNDKVFIKNLAMILDCKEPVLKEDKSERQKLAGVRRRLKKKIYGCKTFLSDAWGLDQPLGNTGEVDSSANVEMWLSKINEEEIDEEFKHEDNNFHEFSQRDADNILFDELHESVSQHLFADDL